LLWTIAVVLMILWTLGMVLGDTLYGFIHVFLAVAIIVLLLKMVRARRFL
jgi:hypothetical protein